jgi:hypothetical protein
LTRSFEHHRKKSAFVSIQGLVALDLMSLFEAVGPLPATLNYPGQKRKTNLLLSLSRRLTLFPVLPVFILSCIGRPLLLIARLGVEVVFLSRSFPNLKQLIDWKSIFLVANLTLYHYRKD